jgi:hypothetical protein
MDTPCRFTIRAMERKTPYSSTVLAVEKGYTLHIHTVHVNNVDCGNKYTLTSALPVFETYIPLK